MPLSISLHWKAHWTNPPCVSGFITPGGSQPENVPFYSSYWNEILLFVYNLFICTCGGLNRHHQSNWPLCGCRNPRLDGSVRAWWRLLPSPFSIVRSRRLAVRREAPGLSWPWLPTSSAGLQFACAACETVWVEVDFYPSGPNQYQYQKAKPH